MYVVLHIFSLFQDNKSYGVITTIYYKYQCVNDLFGKIELGLGLVIKGLDGIKRISNYKAYQKAPNVIFDLKNQLKHFCSIT